MVVAQAVDVRRPAPGGGVGVESAPTARRVLEADRLVAIARAFVREAQVMVPTASGQRRWSLLAASREAEVWAIAWPPGGSIELHDHGGSAGALVVVSGELVETSVAFPDDTGGVVLHRRTLGADQALAFGPNHVHDVVNTGGVRALSVHVYAPRLTTMTYYRLDDGELVAKRATRYALGEAVP
jgi:predicted metal-dependent enzyme (double-stranded beta helix superfamily)